MSKTGSAVEEGRPIRVCLVAPSLDILGGQAVQAAKRGRRLLEQVCARRMPLEVG